MPAISSLISPNRPCAIMAARMHSSRSRGRSRIVSLNCVASRLDQPFAPTPLLLWLAIFSLAQSCLTAIILPDPSWNYQKAGYGLAVNDLEYDLSKFGLTDELRHFNLR